MSVLGLHITDDELMDKYPMRFALRVSLYAMVMLTVIACLGIVGMTINWLLGMPHIVYKLSWDIFFVILLMTIGVTFLNAVSWRNDVPISSTNHSFDEYKEEAIKKLEVEEQEFQKFLSELRHERERQEFEQFKQGGENDKS